MPVPSRRARHFGAALAMLLLIFFAAGSAPGASAPQSPFPDLSSVPADLAVPDVTSGAPAPGRRVPQTLPQYEGTGVHHVLYLPTDWQPGRRYPVIVEYAGNGNYKNKYGDVSTGLPEGSKLGYGISGGKGFIWLCLPYVNIKDKKNEINWWGDVPATLDYCIQAVTMICERWGGDPQAVLLAGFSRGAIGCNYLGLHNDKIAGLWAGFIAYSHYDGVRDWNWEGGRDKAAARERLARLKGRPTFVCQEGTTSATQAYLAQIPESKGNPFTFVPIPFRNHNDAWTLRDTPQRRQLRAWVEETLKECKASEKS